MVNDSVALDIDFPIPRYELAYEVLTFPESNSTLGNEFVDENFYLDTAATSSVLPTVQVHLYQARKGGSLMVCMHLM